MRTLPGCVILAGAEGVQVSRQRRGALLGVLALALLTGCADVPGTPSGEGLITVTPTPLDSPTSAAQLQAQMLDAVKSSQSTHVLGLVKKTGTPVTIDVATNAVRRTHGTVTVAGHVLDVVADDQTLYVRADANYWNSVAPALTPSVANKWARTPVSTPTFSTFASLLNYDALVTSPLSTTGELTELTATLFENQAARALSNASTQILILPANSPLPSGFANDSFGNVRYAEWGPVLPYPVPSADVVDLQPSQLVG